MRHASLFSGIGGFDLAAQWMGWENVFQCEIDPFCTKVLEHHFPTTTRHEDIRELDGTQYTGKIDILTGGFPCQPFSAAGKRRGTEDNRYLWPEMLRCIREAKPAWIVAENVRGILNIEQGMVFEQVCIDMEDEGYEVQPFNIPACSLNAPHKRERIWFVAHSVSNSYQCEKSRSNGEEKKMEAVCRKEKCATGEPCGTIRNGRSERYETSANHQNKQCERSEQEGDRSWKPQKEIGDRDWDDHWMDVAAELFSVDDGLPRELDGITIPKWRRESLKAYGNAIVPQVAHQIFKSLPL